MFTDGDYLGFIDLIGTGSPITLTSTLDSQSDAVSIPSNFSFGVQNVTTVYVSQYMSNLSMTLTYYSNL